MTRQLLILEVSKKQDYIFSSKRLKENVAKSKEIAEITSVDFFKNNGAELFNEEENMVYSGGGHTVLQFETREQAVKFADVITKAVIKKLPEIEVFVKCMEYDKDKTPGENLKELAKELEKKKALRQSSFRYMSIGIEDNVKSIDNSKYELINKIDIIDDKGKYNFPNDIKYVAVNDDNFIAVVHIDGNAMGTKVNSIYKKYTEWNQCCEKLREFSKGIQEDFEAAFYEMVDVMRNNLSGFEIKDKDGILVDPVKLAILAGDDVCFITSGNIGIECARVFLEKLSKKKNRVDGNNYSACAGVAIVHSKYPFHKAYKLSEELCSNAKKLGVMYDKNSTLSLIDWHIEFGQMKDGLDRLREDYVTEDGCQLELRPYLVCGEPKCSNKDYKFRSYTFFKRLCKEFTTNNKIVRGKIKELRIPMKQGEIETNHYIKKMQITDMLYNIIVAEFGENYIKEMLSLKDEGQLEDKKSVYRKFKKMDEKIVNDNNDAKEDNKDKKNKKKEDDNTIKRNLIFDAIEVLDHYIMFEEEEHEQ